MKADIGLAFDGDGDRLITVDDKGQVITGDRILAICAKDFKTKGLLKNNLVVSTVMSNLGLRVALKKMGIKHVMTKVGDRYVSEEMRSSGAVIGGEDSGHMIFSDHHSTGDGMLTALKLIEAMQTESKPLSELKSIMAFYPQVLINVEASHKPEIQSIPEVAEAMKEIENKLGEQGRVLGFDGKTLIHPAQLDTANRVFSPDADAVAEARAIIAAFALPENQGKGVITVGGRMTELLHLAQAERLVAIADAIAAQS